MSAKRWPASWRDTELHTCFGEGHDLLLVYEVIHLLSFMEVSYFGVSIDEQARKCRVINLTLLRCLRILFLHSGGC